MKQVAQTIGDEMLVDDTTIRSGQDFQDAIRDAISSADVFQLFWSHNAATSAFVRSEWQYALSLNRPNFVRPVYWEIPMPPIPPELSELHFMYLSPNALTGDGDASAANTGATRSLLRSVFRRRDIRS